MARFYIGADPEARAEVNRVLRSAALKLVFGDIDDRQLRAEIRTALPSATYDDDLDEEK